MEHLSEKKSTLLLDEKKINTKFYKSAPYNIEVGTLHWCNDMGCHTTPTHTLHLGGRSTKNKNRERRPLYILKICEDERILVLSSTTRSSRGWEGMPEQYRQYFLPIAPTPMIDDRRSVVLEEDPEAIFFGKSLLYLELNVVIFPRKLMGYIGRVTTEGQKLIHREFHDLCNRIRQIEEPSPNKSFQSAKEVSNLKVKGAQNREATVKSPTRMKSSARIKSPLNVKKSPSSIKSPTSVNLTSVGSPGVSSRQDADSPTNINHSVQNAYSPRRRGGRRGKTSKHSGGLSTNPQERVIPVNESLLTGGGLSAALSGLELVSTSSSGSSNLSQGIGNDDIVLETWVDNRQRQSHRPGPSIRKRTRKPHEDDAQWRSTDTTKSPR